MECIKNTTNGWVFLQRVNNKEALLFSMPSSLANMALSDRLFSIAALDGAESVLLHKNSNKSSNILLHEVLSAPSFGCY